MLVFGKSDEHLQEFQLCQSLANEGHFVSAGIALDDQFQQAEHSIFDPLRQDETLRLGKLPGGWKQPAHVVIGLGIDL